MATSPAGFMDPGFLLDVGPRQFPRQVERLVWHLGFTNVAVVDGPGDEGGDVIGRFRGEDWVLQCKWKRRAAVGAEAVDEVFRARDAYKANKAAVVTNTRMSPEAERRAKQLALLAPKIAFWNGQLLTRAFAQVPDRFGQVELRGYQLDALDRLAADLDTTGRGLLILATGLGKTVVGGAVIDEHLRRFPEDSVLIVAHTKDLVAQLERALWPQLAKVSPTRVLTGDERPDDLRGVTCATVGSALSAARFGWRPGLVMVDEAHHVGEDGQYPMLLDLLTTARQFGVTATPWRGDSADITHRFGPVSDSVGIEEGMRRGYLARVDYRLFVDNVDWDVVRAASKNEYSLAELNSKLFIPYRDEAIRDELVVAWSKTTRPRAIVFCRTIEHAERMADLLCGVSAWPRARAIHAGLGKRERQQRLLEFRSGAVPILTAVDILNEGVDVPDVNILCFARVTHSRRVFVQQLGRGLRLRDGKDHVTVLDFVSDLRRIAATLNIRRALVAPGDVEVLPRVAHSRVEFSDQRVESLMNEWIADAASLETSFDDHRLTFQFPAALAPLE